MKRVLAQVVVALVAATSFFVVGGSAANATTSPPPTLAGQRVYIENLNGGLTGDCDAAGTSALTLDSSNRPDAFDVMPLLPEYVLPYPGAFDVDASVQVGPLVQPPADFDFSPGWINSHPGTRGLPSGIVQALHGTFSIVSGDTTITGTLELPDGAVGIASCYEDLTGSTSVDPLPVLESGHQFFFRALAVDYQATITTPTGVYLDEGTVALSSRDEDYRYSCGTGCGGGAVAARVEAIFTSTLPAVESTDAQGPEVTCAPTAALVNQPGVEVSATVTDAGSGPETATVSAVVDTSAPGTHAVSLTGRDLAGNETTVSCSYSVGYRFTGFQAPVDNAPVVNTVNAGRSIPIKWRVTDFNGVGIDDPSSFVNVTSGSTSCNPNDPHDQIETTSGQSGLHYQGDGNWSYVWGTPSQYAGQCRSMNLNLGDGSHHVASFQFK